MQYLGLIYRATLIGGLQVVRFLILCTKKYSSICQRDEICGPTPCSSLLRWPASAFLPSYSITPSSLPPSQSQDEEAVEADLDLETNQISALSRN